MLNHISTGHQPCKTIEPFSELLFKNSSRFSSLSVLDSAVRQVLGYDPLRGDLINVAKWKSVSRVAGMKASKIVVAYTGALKGIRIDRDTEGVLNQVSVRSLTEPSGMIVEAVDILEQEFVSGAIYTDGCASEGGGECAFFSEG